MERILRDQKDTIQAKPEDESIAQSTNPSSSLSIGTSRRWSGFKNPRIVRVSRTFGGKDRHSKVCTIRGLRDRRIRLSVPTAIQLYDLQERLGLSQPSKVIDWLLDATKLDIDELPPLHFPPFHDQHSLIGQLSNNFAPTHNLGPYLDSNLTLMNGPSPQIGSSSMMIPRKEGININDNTDVKYYRDEDEDEDEDSRNSLDNVNQYHLPSLMNSAAMVPYGNLYHWDPSSLSLSQFGSHGFHLGPLEESNHNGYHPSTQQMLFCPPMPIVTASLFPQSDTSAATSSAFHPSGSMLKALAPHDLHSAGSSQQYRQGD
ncbi:hypothetical protein V2J09_020436 [Rumex salicifolius]